MTGIIIGFTFYLILMVGIGIFTYATQKDRSIQGFILGGRNFGPILSAFGMGTTLASGYAFIGLVGMGYTLGIITMWQPILVLLFEFIMWFFLAKKSRTYSIKSDSITTVEMISKFRGDPHNLIKIIGGILIGVFVMFQLAGNFNAAAKAATVLSIDFRTAAIGCCLLVMAYTMLGGVRAVMLTDAVQGFIMLAAFFLLFFVAVHEVGGYGTLFNTLATLEPSLIHWDNGRPTSAAVFYIAIFWVGSASGFLGQPQGIQKFIIMDSNKSIQPACVGSILFNFIRQYFPIMIGMCGRVVFPDISDPEMTVPMFITTSFSNVLGGIILAAIFAAIMSTADSQLLQSASEISRNVLQNGLLRHKRFTEKTLANICRVITAIVALLGLFACLFGDDNVYTLLIFSFTGLAASTIAPMYLGFYWKRITSWGLLAGISSGIPLTYIWFRAFKASTGIHECFAGIGGALLLTVLVSLLTQKSNTVTRPDMVPMDD